MRLPELFFDSALLPFHFCVVAIFVLIIGETIGIYIGHRPSNFIRTVIPSWIKDSPLLKVQISRFIILLFFLINLSYAGYFIQLSFFAFHKAFISSSLIFIPAFIMAWFFTLFMIHCLDQVIQPSQTSCQVDLVGRFATIVSGQAKPGASANAQVKDHMGGVHYVQVEPEFGELELHAHIILVGYNDSHYIGKKITPQRDEHLPQFYQDKYDD